MVHLKTVLDTRRRKSDGTFPVIFRIANIKKVHVIQSGKSVKENDWDKQTLVLKATHPNHRTINLTLTKRYYELQKTVLQLKEVGAFNFDQLKAALFSQAIHTTGQNHFFKLR